ncbi:MAG TPA: ATP-binding protein [Candidatus Saccharimonadales bacterium]|nr:ATP-binding protein [Candidatus Saccharimonadales bacterium]
MSRGKLIGKILVMPVLVVLPLLSDGIASASVYGQGSYDTCQYEVDCPTPPVTTPTPTPSPPPVKEHLPSGLVVTINLTENQHIPQSGYNITIVPLNGHDTTFKQAEIYIDNQLITTQQPQSDGSVTWHWDPLKYPGKKVTIVITDSTGKRITYAYDVIVVQVGAAGTTGLTTPTSIPGHIAAAIRHIIKSLPKTVVYTLPYTIFLLLIANAIVLLLQTKREIAEKHTLDRLIAHEQAINQAKANLIELVSHYIRTPLTLIRSGVEMLHEPAVPADVISQLQACIKGFSANVEATVSTQLNPLLESEDVPIVQPMSLKSGAAILRLWLPLVLGGLFVFAFVYLTNHETSYDAGTANEIIQVATFSLIVFSSYQLFRRVVLRRRDNENSRAVLSQQMLIDETRDNVINDASQSLKGELAKLSAITSKLPAGNDTKFIRRGQHQLQELTDRMIIASHLKGSHSNENYNEVSAQTVFENALQKILPKAQAAGVDVQLQQDSPLTTQNAGLLTLVLQSLIDNGVSYSKDKGKVTVTAAADQSANSIDVIDHGSGIEADKLSQLFQPFFKAEGAEEFNHEGAGFSLYLDKLIMLYLGGDISIESTPNQSTVAHLDWDLS